MQVAGLVSGNFFKEKIDEAVQRLTTAQAVFCDSIADIKASTPTVVIVDLEHPDSHLALREYGARAIAFGPHSGRELLAVAREFGAQAYPRGVFFSQLDKLLHQYV